ncbi:unnamed protein product [Protopolystoma xenopodis]|uniref:Uncharacterized protein n=1 Tax=Protopolystoma xenopodis TaxID=117903 RepID=A0A448WSX2_9PLAT|nr:unnamed protein product [Protopolystoma xenopodis]
MTRFCGYFGQFNRQNGAANPFGPARWRWVHYERNLCAEEKNEKKKKKRFCNCIFSGSPRVSVYTVKPTVWSSSLSQLVSVINHGQAHIAHYSRAGSTSDPQKDHINPRQIGLRVLLASQVSSGAERLHLWGTGGGFCSDDGICGQATSVNTKVMALVTEKRGEKEKRWSFACGLCAIRCRNRRHRQSTAGYIHNNLRINANNNLLQSPQLGKSKV